MTLSDPLAAVGTLTTIAGALLAMVRWVFAVSAKADQAMDEIRDIRENDLKSIRAQREADNAVYSKRLEKAEEAAMNIRDLAAAVRHQGDMTSMQLKALTEKIGEHAEYTRESFAEIRTAQKGFETQLQTINRQTK